VSDFQAFFNGVEANKARWIEIANRDVAFGLSARGGGVREIQVRKVPRGSRPEDGFMAVVHVHADPCDAMGANVINQVCEYLKAHVEMDTGEKVAICILSN